ncbi:DUF5667 domain-containing protein [Nocardioides sp.]|uniref:DUF5667 domain-containing protein n=1 Tax=Nocardioides sp. TaxID=35761 RepID=UPI0027346A6E|nr:DUF5667 domain-containing protein [Nocardioides sp.]MDP3891671.1 DUF5667 domain-containing protein [Nocardioides sp.]
MTWVRPARKRAEEFAALVEGQRASDPRFADLLSLVADLRTTEAPEPRAEFVTSLREQLMVEADTVLLPRDLATEERLRLPARTTTSRPNRRLAVAAGAIAMVGASASMAVAAQTSLPGDTLYPVKRALEEAQTSVTRGQQAQGLSVLDNATGRLEEAAGLAQRGTPSDLRSVETTLATFVEQSQQGSDALLAHYAASGDETSVEAVRDFTATSMEYLQVIKAAVPDESGAAVLDAAESIKSIDAAAASACPSCGGTGVGQIPQILLFSAGQSPDDVAAALPLPEIEPGTTLEPAEPEDSIELPDLDGPVSGDATGKTGLPGLPGQPQTAPEGPATGTVTKSGAKVGKALDDLTRGLTGGSSTDPGLLTGVGETVDELLDPVTSTLEQTLNGLLGGG